jgi:hypothetical protein
MDISEEFKNFIGDEESKGPGQIDYYTRIAEAPTTQFVSVRGLSYYTFGHFFTSFLQNNGCGGSIIALIGKMA